MKTVKEMLDFSAECKCKMTKAMSKGVEVVAQNLSENEVVNYCIGALAEGNNAQIAFAITNLRAVSYTHLMENPNCFAFVDRISKNVTLCPRIVLSSPSFTSSRWTLSPINFVSFGVRSISAICFSRLITSSCP